MSVTDFSVSLSSTGKCPLRIVEFQGRSSAWRQLLTYITDSILMTLTCSCGSHSQSY